jgi:putative F5/8 type C domain protein
MKRYIYIIALAFAATTFTSCSHDYNYDGEYDIPGYFHGSDPRNNLVHFSTNVVKYDNPFSADIPLGEDSHAFTLKANISRALTKAAKVQIALAADAPLLSTTYNDYQVISANQVVLPNNGAFEFNTETTQIDIPVTVNGLTKMNKPTVVPIRITPADGELGSPQTVKEDYAYIVITPKDVWEVYLDEADLSVKLDGSNTTYVRTPSVTVLFTTDSLMTADCEVGLERDNSLFQNEGNKKLAPEGIEVTSKVNAKNQQEIQTTVQLQHPEKFTASGEYVLPMRAVYYDKDGNKHYIANGKVLIPINVIDARFALSPSEPSGTEISSSDFTLTLSPQLRYGSIEDLTDGNTEDYDYLAQGVSDLTIDLKQTENVKGIKLGMFISSMYNYYPEYVKVYGSTDGTNWTPMSDKLNLNQVTWNNINATKTVNVRYLKIEFHVSDAFGSLTEVKVFK